MRVLIVDTYYEAFLRTHYAERPELAEASYEAQLDALLERQFGTGDAYSRELRRLGHEAQEIVPNAPVLQGTWAREHGRARGARLAAALPTRFGVAARQALAHRIALAQIAAYDPDVLYCQDLWFFTKPELDALRRRGILVCGQIASEPPPPSRLQGYDLILTSFPHYVERFRALGVASEYLAIAFDQTVPERLGVPVAPEAERPHGVVFVGGVDPAVHPAGTALIERLCERIGLDVWGYGADRLEPGSPILAHHHGEAWGLDMFRVLARAQVVVNRHIEAAEGNANNMRLFEATGCGAALVTEAAPNLGELFEPGREVATTTGEDELVATVQRLLGDDAERLAVARAGQARTMAEHTYAKRIEQLAEVLERHLASKRP